MQSMQREKEYPRKSARSLPWTTNEKNPGFLPSLPLVFLGHCWRSALLAAFRLIWVGSLRLLGSWGPCVSDGLAVQLWCVVVVLCAGRRIESQSLPVG